MTTTIAAVPSGKLVLRRLMNLTFESCSTNKKKLSKQTKEKCADKHSNLSRKQTI